MMNKVLSAYVGILAAALALGGCASGATAEGMTVKSADLEAPANPAMANAMSVGNVGGGKATNPIWLSQIGNADFKRALVRSLYAAGLLSPDGRDAKYSVKAELVHLAQPLAGFDMEVVSAIRYTVTDAKTGAVVFDEEVVAFHTATMNDSAIGVTRLRLANEGSARRSIAKLIEKLNAGTAQRPAVMTATHSL